MRNPNWRARKSEVFEPALANRPSGPRQGDSKVALVKQGVRGALRAKNLRLLLDTAPAPEDLALLAEVPRERLQNMANGALCSDETAYHLEQQLELPSGWLDRVNGAVPARYLELLAHPPLLDEDERDQGAAAGATGPALPPTLQPAQAPLPVVDQNAPAAPANSPAYRPADSPANARRAALQAVVGSGTGSPAPVHDAQPATPPAPQPATVKPASPSSSKQASKAAEAKKPPKAPVKASHPKASPKTPPKAPVKALAKAPPDVAPKASVEKPVEKSAEKRPEKKAGSHAKTQPLKAPSKPAPTSSIPPAPHQALAQPLPHAEPAVAPARRREDETSSAAAQGLDMPAAAPRQASLKTPKVPVVLAATPPLPDSLSPKKEEAAMTSPTELHRANLNVLLSGKGAKSALARLLGLSPASVTGMLNGAKPLDQALLDTVSRVAKLEDGWFDSARTPDDISADTQALLSPLVRGSVAPAPATAATATPATPAHPSGGSAKGAAAAGTPHPPATSAHAATGEAAQPDKPHTWPASGSKVARLRGMAEQDPAAGGAVKGGARAPEQSALHEPPPPHRTPEAQRGDVPPEVHAVLVDKALPPIAEALIRTLAQKASTGALSEDQAFELLGSVRALP